MIRDLFRKKTHLKIGLYGPPNGGKTTLANRICKDWLGEEMGSVSNLAHETREVHVKEQVNIKSKDGKECAFWILASDSPLGNVKKCWKEYTQCCYL